MRATHGGFGPIVSALLEAKANPNPKDVVKRGQGEGRNRGGGVSGWLR